MSSSDLAIKQEPSEAPEAADQTANHRVDPTDLLNQLRALTSVPPQTGYETDPFDGNRNNGLSAGEMHDLSGDVHDPNGQRRKTTKRGDSSKEHETTSQGDFVSSCKAWEKWYNIKQRDSQTVIQFREYLQRVLKLLPLHESGGPSMIERFHRLRSGLRDPIKAILDAQIIQPITYDDLVNVALRIEEKEMDLLGNSTLSRRKPLGPVAPSKPSKPIPSSYRPKPNQYGHTPPQRAKPAPDHSARVLGPAPSRISKRSRRKNNDIGIPRHLGLPMDQTPTGDKNNKNSCYICGKFNHITSECREGGSKFFGAPFPVRPKVPENPLLPNSHWNPQGG